MLKFDIVTICVIFLLLIFLILLSAVLIYDCYKQNKNVYSKRNVKKYIKDSNFSEIVNKSYDTEINNIEKGSIKLNILTNDTKNNNELFILDKFKKFKDKKIFVDLFYKVNGDID